MRELSRRPQRTGLLSSFWVIVCAIIWTTGCSQQQKEGARGTGNTSPPHQTDPRIGRRVHITGCENGELSVPVVNLWNTAQRTSVIGKVSGDGREDRGLRCQGSVVIIRDVATVEGREMYQVETVVGDQIGWVSAPFIGRTFDTSTCHSFFADAPNAARKCGSG